MDALIEAAGTDPQSRLEACVRAIGFNMLDDQIPYRRLAKAALDQWFKQAEAPDEEQAPVRQGRRDQRIAMVVAPLRGRVAKKDIDRIAHALGVIVGTDSMIALTDGMGLDVPEAKKALLDASRWLLVGGLAELEGKADYGKAACPCDTHCDLR